MINSTVASALESVRSALDAKHLTVSQNIPLNVDVAVNSVALQQLLTSTLDNAVKFSQAGGAIEVSAITKGANVELAIHDNGIGIPKDRLSQLMTPFSRATDVMRFDYEGMGLSLYLDKVIMEQIGGSLSIASEEGKGTTVTLLLPRS